MCDEIWMRLTYYHVSRTITHWNFNWDVAFWQITIAEQPRNLLACNEFHIFSIMAIVYGGAEGPCEVFKKGFVSPN